MTMYLEVFRGWRRTDQELLPALRSLYAYDDRWPGRATGWLYSALSQGQLLPRDWPEPLGKLGPGLLAALAARTGVIYTAAAYQAYMDGAGTDWHYDREWDAQAIISLGVTRRFGIRSRGEDPRPFYMSLQHGDLLVLHPGMQDKFEHCIPGEDVRGERCSIVFRGCYRPLAAISSHQARCGPSRGASLNGYLERGQLAWPFRISTRSTRA